MVGSDRPKRNCLSRSYFGHKYAHIYTTMHKSCMTLTRISLSLPSSNLDITSPAIYSSAVEARNTQSSTLWLTKWSAKMSQPRYRHLYLVGLISRSFEQLQVATKSQLRLRVIITFLLSDAVLIRSPTPTLPIVHEQHVSV